MCGSMADIQSAAAEIRRGKKERKKKKPPGKNIMSASATQGGHKNQYSSEVGSVKCGVLYNSGKSDEEFSLRRVQSLQSSTKRFVEQHVMYRLQHGLRLIMRV